MSQVVTGPIYSTAKTLHRVFPKGQYLDNLSSIISPFCRVSFIIQRNPAAQQRPDILDFKARICDIGNSGGRWGFCQGRYIISIKGFGRLNNLSGRNIETYIVALNCFICSRILNRVSTQCPTDKKYFTEIIVISKLLHNIKEERFSWKNNTKVTNSFQNKYRCLLSNPEINWNLLKDYFTQKLYRVLMVICQNLIEIKSDNRYT